MVWQWRMQNEVWYFCSGSDGIEKLRSFRWWCSLWWRGYCRDSEGDIIETEVQWWHSGPRGNGRASGWRGLVWIGWYEVVRQLKGELWFVKSCEGWQFYGEVNVSSGLKLEAVCLCWDSFVQCTWQRGVCSYNNFGEWMDKVSGVCKTVLVWFMSGMQVNGVLVLVW